MSPVLHLAVQYPSQRDCPTRPQLRRWIITALRAAEVANEAHLVLRFVDATEGRALNRAYRQKDYATNVLTFGYETDDSVNADIVLCAPVVEKEARQQRKAPHDHYAHMVVHGVLHACGFEHDHDLDAKAMEALEKSILARFRIDDPYVQAARKARSG